MKKIDVKKVKQEINKAYGIPEVVARIAEESDNQTVREKWDELTTIVHLVHKDKVLKKRQEANDLSKTFDEIEHRLRLIKNASNASLILKVMTKIKISFLQEVIQMYLILLVVLTILSMIHQISYR